LAVPYTTRSRCAAEISTPRLAQPAASTHRHRYGREILICGIIARVEAKARRAGVGSGEGGQAALRRQTYGGSHSPCASINLSTNDQIWSRSNSAAVWGSSMAAW